MAVNVIATLRVRRPGKEEFAVPLADGQTLRVGRDDGNELVIEDFSVSRVHAAFTASHNGVVLADMASRNGTFVNGDRIVSLRDLSSGDIIDIGPAKITVEIQSNEIINSLSSSFSSRAMTAELKPVSVTVLVASVADWTKLSRSVPQPEVDAMLERWREATRTVIEALDGAVDKVVGRSMVALWMGRDAKMQACNAVQAAGKIRGVTAQLSQKPEWGKHAANPWDCTVVLAAGAGLKGRGGGQSDKGFTLLGDPINLAFRLEEAIAKLGQRFIIPKVTADLIKDQIAVRKIIGVKIRDDEPAIDVFVPA